MENNKFVIKKIPLQPLLNLLNNLYMDGADFVDLYKETVNDVQDSITVSIPIEYMSDSKEQEMFPAPPPPGVEEEGEKEELTDEDIKNIINDGF